MSGGNIGSATEQEHYHAFLSHNGADKPLVEIVAAELEKRGICCWLDKWNLIPGDPWQVLGAGTAPEPEKLWSRRANRCDPNSDQPAHVHVDLRRDGSGML